MMGKIDVNKFHRKTKANCPAKKALSSTIPDSNWNWIAYWQAKKWKIKERGKDKSREMRTFVPACSSRTNTGYWMKSFLMVTSKEVHSSRLSFWTTTLKKNTAWWGPWKEAMRGSEKGWTNYKEMHKRVHQVAHKLWDKRWTELGGKRTYKNLHKIFPHDPAELMPDVFQETHLKWKENALV